MIKHDVNKEIDLIREDFPVFRHRSYLDSACYAPGCTKVAAAVNDWYQSSLLMSTPSFEQTFGWLQPAINARDEAIKLLHANENEVAFTSSTTLALNKLANAIDWKKGDNIVLNDLEFPSNTIPWMQQRRFGVELRRTEHRGGKLYIEDFEKVVDKNTRVIAVSSVQWSSGFRIDLKKLVDLAESYDAIVVVDSAQSLSALELDVRKTGIHFMATQAHKWMFGPFGTGLIYCREDMIDKYVPLELESGNILKNPERMPYHHQPLLDNIYDYDMGIVPTAARFQTCPNLPGLWGLYESLKYVNKYGIENIENRIQNLVDYALDKLTKLNGYEIVSPFEREERSGIIMVTTGRAEDDVKMMQQLSQSGVGVSVRYQANCGGIRISTHFFNNEDDIDRLVMVMGGKARTMFFH
ncbi:MAG: aminotransferase class V-fold PLP-dependent enzyme [Dehalobacterium sp.]